MKNENPRKNLPIFEQTKHFPNYQQPREQTAKPEKHADHRIFWTYLKTEVEFFLNLLSTLTNIFLGEYCL